jgi:hypothetical protein
MGDRHYTYNERTLKNGQTLVVVITWNDSVGPFSVRPAICRGVDVPSFVGRYYKDAPSLKEFSRYGDAYEFSASLALTIEAMSSAFGDGPLTLSVEG